MKKNLRVLLVLLAFLALKTPAFAVPPFVVSGTGDDVNDPTTLRYAITQLNAVLSGTTGSGSIAFKNMDPNNCTISVTAPLPAIEVPVVMTGGAILGSDGVSPAVRIDGSALTGTAAADGLVFTKPSEVDSLAVTGFGGSGVTFNSGCVMKGCFIGVTADGYAFGNGTGITITGSNCTIGTGTSGLLHNLISGNLEAGIWLSGSGATGNRIFGNLIGTDPTGSGVTPMGNVDGIRITDGSGNQIGLQMSGSLNANINLNTISGNTGFGIAIDGGSNNKIDDNLIGLNAAGTAVANASGGVWIDDSAFNRITHCVVSGNSEAGIQIVDGAHDTTVTSNNIGVDSTGSTDCANQGDGIVLGDGTSNNPVWNNQIGGATSGSGGIGVGLGNIITANQGFGIDVLSGSNDTILGNFIGVHADSFPSANSYSGIQITGTGETVGGSLGVAGNVISGNTEDGILVANSGSVTIVGNIIGLDTGSNLASNGGNGVNIQGSYGVQVGDADASLRNVISGNGGAGVMIVGDSNVVLGNYIGADVSGDCTGVGNCGVSATYGGIVIASGSENVLGGYSLSEGNLIVSSSASGIHLTGDQTVDNFVVGNIIGLTLDWVGDISNADNNSVNAGYGIAVDGGASNNTVGGILSGSNIIATDGVDAIYVSDATTTQNTLRGNSTLMLAGGLAIDVIPGANHSPDVPVLSPVVVSGTQLIVSGSFSAGISEQCLVDVYWTNPNASSAGPLQQYVTSGTVVADASGNLAFSIPVGVDFASQTLAVTVTDSEGDTSDFSSPVVAPNIMQFSAGGGTVSVAESNGLGGDNVLILTIVRNGDLSSADSVQWTTQDLSAKAGIDYVAASGTATFAAGSATAQIAVTIKKNDLPNGPRLFQVGLGTPAMAALGLQSVVTVSIVDDQAPNGLFSVSAATPFVDKGKVSSVSFIVNRAPGSSSLGGAVSYMTANGTAIAGAKKDYTAVAGTLNFGAAQTFAVVSVPISTKAPYKPNATFTFKLTACSAGCALTPGATSAVQTICDLKDPHGTLEFSAPSFKANEIGPKATLTVTRYGGATGTVKVPYFTSDGVSPNGAVAGVNYRTASGMLVFKANQKSATISIPTIDDHVFAGNRQFMVSLGASASGGATCGALRTATVVLLDNDNPNGVLQFAASTVAAAKNARSVLVRIPRLGGANGVVAVPYSFRNGSARSGVNFTGRSGVLYFANGVSSATLNVPLVGSRHHRALSFSLALGSPTNGATLGLQQTTTVNLPAN